MKLTNLYEVDSDNSPYHHCLVVGPFNRFLYNTDKRHGCNLWFYYLNVIEYNGSVDR